MSTGIRPLVVSVPNEELAADLQPLPDGVEVIAWGMDGPAPRAEIDIVVPPYMSVAVIMPRLAGVRTRLVQGQSIGYEGIAEHLPPGHTFANAASVHEASTAELAVALTLAAQRSIPDFVRAQGEHRWAAQFTQSLADRRVLLLGYGGVGKAVAARLAGFEVDVTAVASRARTEDGVSVHGVDELGELLPSAEIVIVSLPGGDSTRGFVDDAFLSALPDGALLVNVGRGSLVDTDALVDHLQRGRLRAALDVTDPEPLPADHPLWSAPGAVIAPHVGGASSAMRPRIARLVRRQIERMLAGEEPLNVVIPA
ncbi:2-hydroxyacid dehydrogenase [Microbacterium thalassium]|uniref:Phosphoglycerate dehydrogenase-like enzyme n=1 Tax=Microbacterium thalassium TaxID=362649 RepID=A0A7X0KTI5_9MICO|nr:2-hydroxyacid dehydrogenase [Microbacterium thalassium]MBB6390124.1 phosphoglycerate dehydrogenase-like enzyme [Microbacterium thalassium]